MEGIAKKVGMNFTIYPNQGTPSEWVQGMNAALTAKPDIIVLSTAPDPRTLQPQLEQAKAAGIPVLVTHFYDDSSPVPPACEGCAAGVTALVTAPFNVAGKAAADWIIADSKGNANVLLIGGADVLPSPATLDTISKEFAAQCPACKVTVKNIPVSDWNTKAQSEVQSALDRRTRRSTTSTRSTTRWSRARCLPCRPSARPARSRWSATTARRTRSSTSRTATSWR